MPNEARDADGDQELTVGRVLFRLRDFLPREMDPRSNLFNYSNTTMHGSIDLALIQPSFELHCIRKQAKALSGWAVGAEGSFFISSHIHPVKI